MQAVLFKVEAREEDTGKCLDSRKGDTSLSMSSILKTAVVEIRPPKTTETKKMFRWLIQ